MSIVSYLNPIHVLKVKKKLESLPFMHDPVSVAQIQTGRGEATRYLEQGIELLSFYIRSPWRSNKVIQDTFKKLDSYLPYLPKGERKVYTSKLGGLRREIEQIANSEVNMFFPTLESFLEP